MWLNNVYDPESSTTGDNIREGILWNHIIVHVNVGGFHRSPLPTNLCLHKKDMYVILC